MLSELAASNVDYYNYIAPILAKRCQGCHRPGEIGPMPLLTHAQVQTLGAAPLLLLHERRDPF